jgi:hypothetical protein
MNPTQGAINPILLIVWTVVLFVPIYLALIGGLYLARRYLPEARGLYDLAIEPILFFPAAACAFVIALVLAPR